MNKISTFKHCAEADFTVILTINIFFVWSQPMRIRKKKNLDSRLFNTKQYFISDPFSTKGCYKSEIFGNRPISLEIGCGKGSFLSRAADTFKENSFVGLDKVPEALVIAAERASALDLTNIKFISGDANLLLSMFAPGEIDVIYLNFPDPWPKARHYKRRLTYGEYLKKYLYILAEHGQFFFKTDSSALFEFSLNEIKGSGFELLRVTDDLYPFGPDGTLMTDYEKKFVESGNKINMLHAKKNELKTVRSF